jgi:hypothetical protein
MNLSAEIDVIKHKVPAVPARLVEPPSAWRRVLDRTDLRDQQDEVSSQSLGSVSRQR